MYELENCNGDGEKGETYLSVAEEGCSFLMKPTGRLPLLLPKKPPQPSVSSRKRKGSMGF